MKNRILILSLCSLSYLLPGCTKDQKSQTAPNYAISEKNFTSPLAVGAGGIAGVNWADARDNFVDGWVIPSGLSASDSYSTVSAKADAILSGFQNNMSGINTVRLPINPPSVLQSWWGSYTGAIDRATSKNMKVILGCWEAASSKDGKIDDVTQFWNMWQAVVNKYGGNNNVYFEVFNEPHGYSLSQLTSIYAEFLSRYPSIPRWRIILPGTGYAQDVKGVGADGRFTNCLLAVHNYAFWGNNSTSGWEQAWRSQMGSYEWRTVCTEFGASMTTGKNYTGSQNDNEVAYIVGATNVFRNDRVSSVYWPGLRDNDTYSIQRRGGSGNNITLSTTNNSGLVRIRYGWGL